MKLYILLTKDKMWSGYIFLKHKLWHSLKGTENSSVFHELPITGSVMVMPDQEKKLKKIINN